MQALLRGGPGSRRPRGLGAVVFWASACLMVLEIVASRLLAPYVGVSLYTWTCVIGVVMTGVSLGAWAGGRAADRWDDSRLLGLVLLLAALSSLGVLAVDVLGNTLGGRWSLPGEVLALGFSLFLMPSLCLGAVSPVVARMALAGSGRVGSTVGTIYALGAAGSIAGTFAAGFVLIAWLGTHTIVWGIAASLAALGLAYSIRDRRLSGLGLSVVVAAAVVAVDGRALGGPCERESSYYCIQVWEFMDGDEAAKALVLDRMVHSYAFPERPRRLIQGYARVFAQLTAYRASSMTRPQFLFLGGGGYVLPRYVESAYSGAAIDVVEIDRAVTDVARRRLGLSADSKIVSHHSDARVFLRQRTGRPYDIVALDAFNDLAVPFHLTTREFAREVRSQLAEGGLYLLNVVDSRDGLLIRSLVASLGESFGHVYVLSGKAYPQSPRASVVLLATATPLDDNRMEQATASAERLMETDVGAASLRDRLQAAPRLPPSARGRWGGVLTDRYAPVDQMLARALR